MTITPRKNNKGVFSVHEGILMPIAWAAPEPKKIKIAKIAITTAKNLGYASKIVFGTGTSFSSPSTVTFSFLGSLIPKISNSTTSTNNPAAKIMIPEENLIKLITYLPKAGATIKAKTIPIIDLADLLSGTLIWLKIP